MQQEIGHQVRRTHDLLQVVQNEEQVLLLKLLQDKVAHRHGAWIAKLQRVRYRGRDKGRIGK